MVGLLALVDLALAAAIACNYFCPALNPTTTLGNPPIGGGTTTWPSADDIESVIDQLSRLKALPRTIAEETTKACIGIWAVSQLSDSFDTVCSGNRMPIFVSGGDILMSSFHDLEAIALGSKPPVLTHGANPTAAASGDRFRNWYDRGQWKPNACSNRNKAEEACDEYPYWSVVQGGPGASIKPTPLAESNRQGGLLGGFYSSCAPEGTTFLVVPVPIPGVTSRCIKK